MNNMKENVKYVIIIVITLLVGVGATVGVYYMFPPKGNVVNPNPEESIITIKEDNTIKPSIDKIFDAVVLIENFRGDNSYGTGTGFVYKTDEKFGYIITNHHVIAGGNRIEAVFSDGNVVKADLLGSDEISDIAVLRVDIKHVLLVAKIGESVKTNLGDTVFTVGSPLGKEYMGTVTKGILSGKDRQISVTTSKGQYIMELIQTNAAINPGNSGGPLVNMKGEVIGVNSLKLVENTIEGMGFAIPTEIAMSAVAHLEKGESVERPILGVTLVDSSNEYALASYGIVIDSKVPDGVVIITVEDDYPADVFGFKKADVITKFAGQRISSMAELTFVLYKQDVNSSVEVEYYRDGKIRKGKLKLSLED